MCSRIFRYQGIVTGWGPSLSRADTGGGCRTRFEDARGRRGVAGQVLLGALARNDVWYGGRTNNPWNLNEGSSGSSAGSASATAAGLCGFSIGTETLGSIMSPSQRCGTTGLRPTFGRVSRRGAMVLAATLDKVGPICRAVEDTAMVLSALNGVDPDDRGSISAPFHSTPTRASTTCASAICRRRSAIGRPPSTAEPWRPCRARLHGRRDRLARSAYDALRHILIAEAAANFEDLTFSDRDELLTVQTDEAWPNTFRRARFLSARITCNSTSCDT
ncbi:MAG: hypothetical protein HPM95_16270 [Alphaproteobacteria bacterium]|nr:hypothetical protein [Alphaproteobacteria bacterium]